MNKKGMSVIAICVIAVFSVLIWIFFGNEYKVRATFKDIKGVAVGSPLKYQGLKIGSVSEIKTGSDNKITLVLKVDRDYTGYIREKALFTVSKDFFSGGPGGIGGIL
ncbi:MAG: MCE family protein [Desulfobacterales bacterium]|nr:MCE family protein [Desulfobacterales bacterium]